MEDAVDAVHRPPDAVGVGDVALDDLEAAVRAPRGSPRARPCRRRPRARPACDEPVDDVRADEATPERPRWISEPDGGQAEADQQGIRLVQGEVIGWLNSDDLYLPGAVAGAVRALQAYDACGFVYGNYVDVDEHGDELGRIRAAPFDLRKQIDSRNLVPQPAAFIRRAALDRVRAAGRAVPLCDGLRALDPSRPRVPSGARP